MEKRRGGKRNKEEGSGSINPLFGDAIYKLTLCLPWRSMVSV